jgi:phage-related holin
MVLITALIVASKFENSFVPVVTVVYYYFIFTELKSIIENVEEMGVKVPSFLKGKVDFKLEEYDNDESKDKKEEDK